MQLEVTADGSHTLYVPELQEHYHSTHGAIQESQHVFIQAGLHACKKDKIQILEIGFGTGLNAFLTLLETPNRQIRYHSFELYPLPIELVDQLNYPLALAQDASIFEQLHKASWEIEVAITHNFKLQKIHADFTQLNSIFDQKYDLIYFDAFAPDKQSEMWSQSIFDQLFKHANEGGILVTYCAKGAVRRMLQQAGFEVERLPGPPGKREMLRATKS